MEEFNEESQWGAGGFLLWWLTAPEKNLGGGVSAIQAVMVVSGRTEGTTEKIVSRNGRIVPGTSGKTVKFEKVKKRAAVVDRVF
ncbi:hypothetical protein LXL04_012090 [Taraxacum kok-saghyz]